MSEQKKPANLLVPVLLAALFFGPFLAAVLLYFYGGDGFRPVGSTAHGVLIEAPRTLPAGPQVVAGGETARFDGKWSMLYVHRGDCGPECGEALYRTRQVRRALGREDIRVQRFWVATAPANPGDPGWLTREHPDLVVIGKGDPVESTVLASFGEFQDGDVFLADPLGNVMMRFPAGTSMKDMHKDLSLLLKASQIG